MEMYFALLIKIFRVISLYQVDKKKLFFCFTVGGAQTSCTCPSLLDLCCVAKRKKKKKSLLFHGEVCVSSVTRSSRSQGFISPWDNVMGNEDLSLWRAHDGPVLPQQPDAVPYYVLLDKSGWVGVW